MRKDSIKELNERQLEKVSGGVLPGDGGPGIELPDIVLDPDFRVHPFCE